MEADNLPCILNLETSSGLISIFFYLSALTPGLITICSYIIPDVYFVGFTNRHNYYLMEIVINIRLPISIL